MNILTANEHIENFNTEKCKLKDSFHRSDNGCLVCISETGELFHLYNQIDVSLSRDSRSLVDHLQFNQVYFKHKYFDIPGYRFYTAINKNYKGMPYICEKRETIRNFLKLHNQFYLDNIKNFLGEYDLHPTNLYDVMCFEERIIMTRPIKIIKDEQFFIIGQRRSFIRMLQLYAKSQQMAELFHQRKKNVKDSMVCSVRHFVSKRTTPPEFKCQYQSLSSCVNVVENTVNSVTLLHKPRRLCHHLLEAMISDHSESAVTELFNFKCNFVNADCRDVAITDCDREPVPLAYVYETVFKRTIHLHRYCLPDDYLDYRFLDWFYSNIDVVQNIAPREDVE